MDYMLTDTIIPIDDVCSICLLDIEQDTTDIKYVECCKNKFHNNCYTEWINTKPTCPLCRSVHVLPILDNGKLPLLPILISSRISPINSQNTETIITITTTTTSTDINIQNEETDINQTCTEIICGIQIFKKYRKTIMFTSCVLIATGFLFGIITNGHL